MSVGRDFGVVWLGQGISSLGTAVTTLALPLLALLELHVHAWQVGLLTACTYAAYATLALPAGVWLERRARRPLVIAGDLGRFGALASIPVAQSLDVLTFVQLVVVALVVGALTVVFDVAYQSWLPILVAPDSLVRVNGLLDATASTGRLAGPGVAGFLVASIGAAYTIGSDAASFAIAALATVAVRTGEPDIPGRAEGQARHLRGELRAGLSWLRKTVAMRALVASSTTSNFFVATWLAVEAIFLVDTLRASPGTIGVVLALGSGGGILGGVFAGALSRRFGSCRVIVLSAALGGPFALSAPLGTPLLGPWSVAAGLFGVTFTSAVRGAGATSYRQRATPPELITRVTSAVRLAAYATLPAGSLFGGLLASGTTPRTVMVVAAVGYGAAVLWLLPLRAHRDLPLPGARPVTA
ncbi:MAG TPA: MFS transporter [Mycobacteriales bacterium]|nr:MFS transporter [Mycobacteriales bacterium]